MDDPFSATVSLATSSLGTELRQLLDADNLRPGDEPSYQICKAIYIYHPLGGKMAETPIRLAQSQERDVECPAAPEEALEAYREQWQELESSDHILNVMTQARIYGAASIAMGERGGDVSQPIDLKTLWKSEPYFNVFDPLNTAGSLTTSQDPNSPLFQKTGDITIQGKQYHRSRSVTMLNERALYIAWTSSAFGYVGRSVYQRAFFPMKSFLWTMITDEMVARKAGLIVARLEQPGSIVDRVWRAMAGVKRNLLRQARSDNVISIGKDEILETLNMRNVPDSMHMAREDIIKNIATAADMPAKLLTQESFVEGFGEGTQDAYAVAQYVDRQRIEMRRIYDWFDLICMYRAWSPEFYETIQANYPAEYGNIDHLTAFYRWKKSFKAPWPSLIKEKPSEAVDIEDVKLKAMIAIIQVYVPLVDPVNRVRLLQFGADLVNENEMLFAGGHLDLDFKEMVDFLEEQAEQQKAMASGMGGDQGQLQTEEGTQEPAKPFSSRDSTKVVDLVSSYMADARPMRRLAAQRAALR